MKHNYFVLFFLMLSVHGFAQTDLSQTQSLNIEPADNKIDLPETPNPSSRLNIPSVVPEPLDLDKKPEIKMLPDKELLQAGHDMVIDAKIGEKEKSGDKSHYGDMYLGDIKTTAKFVGIVCRDHEYVDGDRVKIYVNDMVIEPNILLTGAFKGINIDLDKGFNRLDFEALNQGTSGPNTAQVDVYDENGKIIYSNRWNLSTGAKASLIIIKED
ncbi:hypothetical protein GGR42_001582 [Saonia flava]|uniref:Secreted protein n=1 Tax=Saonia flava TaxID=523696 RepID=A0A846QW14_9FLAO|nr:hypothetical protein [Saonia flava]NJB71120.1 hypothetical protein [Saonia flava]